MIWRWSWKQKKLPLVYEVYIFDSDSTPALAEYTPIRSNSEIFLSLALRCLI